MTIEDFVLEKFIGKGSFGKVALAKRKDNKKKIYAMKILYKETIVDRRQVWLSLFNLLFCVY